MTEPAFNPEPRNYSLDGLRGVAALIVVLYHYTVRYSQIYPSEGQPWFTVPWGHYGVRLFFVLSGFVILMTVERARGVGWFLATRFARMFPVFWVALALTFGVVSLVGLPGREATTTQFLWNFTMIPRLFGQRAVDGVYWTLFYEIGFYAVMALCLALRLRRASLLVVAGLVALSVFNVRELTFGSSRLGVARQLWVIEPYWFSLFLIGMTLYDARERFRWFHGALLALAFGQVAMQQWYWDSKEAANPGWPYFGVVAASALLVFAASRWRLPVIASRPLVFLGTISYSWYLIHQNIGYVAMREMQARGVPLMGAIAAAFIGSIGLAVALTFLVEKPANRVIRGWLTPRQDRAAAAPTRQATPAA